jgi:hypothetical protein
MSMTVFKRGSDMVLSKTGFVPFVVASVGLTASAMNAVAKTAIRLVVRLLTSAPLVRIRPGKTLQE